ncbi:hypothetical protein, partial [Nocardiopsis oceani]
MVEVRAVPAFGRVTPVGLGADACHAAGALTGRVSRLVMVCGGPLGLGADACPCAGALTGRVSRLVMV